ncbi:MAG TPA: ATP-binding protein [Chromatiaceae bacterium]|nr:ATP-binding protein [Chromatiaceae bacterium]
MTTPLSDPLAARAKALKLHGLLAHWEDIATAAWVAPLIAWEEDERARRGLERRLGNAHLGRFKPLADFDWHWPTQCDRSAIEDLMGLRFLGEAATVVLVGPNGVGKTMIARNIAHQAVLAGHTVLFTSAGHMLNELAGADGDNALRHRLSVYARPRRLVVDEVGYLSYSNRHADLLFEIVSRR